MSSEHLTPDQETRIRSAIKRHIKSGLFIGFKYGLLLVAATVFIIVVNGLYVQSKSFAFIMNIINMMFTVHLMAGEARENNLKYTEEISKILNEEK